MRARRLGGIPPLVTVLITISAVVAAGIVAYFLFTTTSSAARTPMLEVTSAYALCSGTSCYVYITLRNVGTVNVNITSVSYFDVSGVTVSTSSWYNPSGQLLSSSNPVVVPAGGSAYLKGVVTVSGTTTGIPDGAGTVLTLTVQTPSSSQSQSLSLAFKIARQ
jgi:hypothetical protein